MPRRSNITGWKMDDNSNAFGNAVALRGVPTIPRREIGRLHRGIANGSTDAAIIAASRRPGLDRATPPAGFLIGAYGGSGVGLSTGGDAVNLFDASGHRVTGVVFGSSTTGFTFDNAAGLGSRTLPLPAISTLSVDSRQRRVPLPRMRRKWVHPGVSFLNRPPVANAGPDQTDGRGKWPQRCSGYLERVWLIGSRR